MEALLKREGIQKEQIVQKGGVMQTPPAGKRLPGEEEEAGIAKAFIGKATLPGQATGGMIFVRLAGGGPRSRNCSLLLFFRVNRALQSARQGLICSRLVKS